MNVQLLDILSSYLALWRYDTIRYTSKPSIVMRMRGQRRQLLLHRSVTTHLDFFNYWGQLVDFLPHFESHFDFPHPRADRDGTEHSVA